MAFAPIETELCIVGFERGEGKACKVDTSEDGTRSRNRKKMKCMYGRACSQVR